MITAEFTMPDVRRSRKAVKMGKMGSEEFLTEDSSHIEATRSGSVPTDRKFTGQRLDGTALYYYNARYYDPGIGRFISPDSIIQAPNNPQSLNRYSYVVNNPLAYTDPTGNCWGRFRNTFGCGVARESAKKVADLATDAGKAVASTASESIAEMGRNQLLTEMAPAIAVRDAMIPDAGVQGVSGSVGGSVPVFVDGQVCLCVDSTGQVAFVPSLTVGGSTGIAGSITGGVTKSDAERVKQLRGDSANVGGSVPAIGTLASDTNIGKTQEETCRVRRRCSVG